MSETTFWKTIATLSALLLAGSVAVNLLGSARVAPQFTAFLFGCLAAMATGYAVVSPRSSVARLDARAEQTLRRRQYTVGLVISILLAATLLIPVVRAAPSSWALVPVILLSPVLIARESILKKHINWQQAGSRCMKDK